jgi:hypothetical protein
MLAMPLNPYESPQSPAHGKRLREAVCCPALISMIVVPLAAIAGGSIFLASMYGMAELAFHSSAFQVSLAAGIAAIYGVQMAADGYIHQQQRAWGAPIIGMLLASPIAVGVAICLAFVTYGMSTKRVPGAELVAALNLSFFFLTLSMGSWLAVCRTPRVVVLGNQSSN